MAEVAMLEEASVDQMEDAINNANGASADEAKDVTVHSTNGIDILDHSPQ